MKLTYFIEVGTGGVDFYLPVPSKGMILGASVSNDTDPGATSSLVFLSGSTTLGTADITDAAIGTTTAMVPSADVKTPIAAGGCIKLTGTVTAAAGLGLIIDFDEYARTSD